MLRSRGLLYVICALSTTAFGQIKKQFTVEDTPSCDQVRLTLQAGSSNCSIKSGTSDDILNVYSNVDPDQYTQNFVKEIQNHLCNVVLSLEDQKNQGIAGAFSYSMFGDSNNSENTWRMYLTEEKPYQLELNYGMGNANIDLSGLAIKRIKVISGSANVNVGYYSDLQNKVEMDTFSIQVDLGSVSVKNLCYARTRNVVADVGFGNMILDLSAKPLVPSTVKGSVGAGSLIILLPDRATPIMLKVHNSWLCSVSMPAYFKKIDDNTFTTASYSQNAANPLLFDLDVSMGNIVFK